MFGNQNDKKAFSEKVANDPEFANKIKKLFDWLAEQKCEYLTKTFYDTIK